jgi:hypothetical protein
MRILRIALNGSHAHPLYQTKQAELSDNIKYQAARPPSNTESNKISWLPRNAKLRPATPSEGSKAHSIDTELGNKDEHPTFAAPF